MSAETTKILKRLRELGDPGIAAHSQRFFKTGKGEYGAGDRFLGIRVPVIRKCAKDYRGLPLDENLELLQSPFHEARLLAVLLLVARYTRADTQAEKQAIYRSYLRHTAFINNWDLVDCSAEHVVGAYLYARSRKPLLRLADSGDLWERRIAVMSTFHFIRRSDYTDALTIIETLLRDTEDLIHKAAGWMLREIGNRDGHVEREFLKKYYWLMPRTMLRYAIEKFPEQERLAFLKGEVV